MKRWAAVKVLQDFDRVLAKHERPQARRQVPRHRLQAVRRQVENGQSAEPRRLRVGSDDVGLKRLGIELRVREIEQTT